jgi:hypothetical protein
MVALPGSGIAEPHIDAGFIFQETAEVTEQEVREMKQVDGLLTKFTTERRRGIESGSDRFGLARNASDRFGSLNLDPRLSEVIRGWPEKRSTHQAIRTNPRRAHRFERG